MSENLEPRKPQEKIVSTQLHQNLMADASVRNFCAMFDIPTTRLVPSATKVGGYSMQMEMRTGKGPITLRLHIPKEHAYAVEALTTYVRNWMENALAHPIPMNEHAPGATDFTGDAHEMPDDYIITKCVHEHGEDRDLSYNAVDRDILSALLETSPRPASVGGSNADWLLFRQGEKKLFEDYLNMQGNVVGYWWRDQTLHFVYECEELELKDLEISVAETVARQHLEEIVESFAPRVTVIELVEVRENQCLYDDDIDAGEHGPYHAELSLTTDRHGIPAYGCDDERRLIQSYVSALLDEESGNLNIFLKPLEIRDNEDRYPSWMEQDKQIVWSIYYHPTVEL